MKLTSLRSLIAVALAIAPPSFAQDPVKVAPGNYNCTLENAQTRLCEFTLGPGGKIPTHSHPNHAVYVLAPGKLRITDDATGKADEHDFKAGQTVWIPAVTHHAENIGDTTLKGLVIEYRDRK